ncbi:MAG: hypothetical protein HOV83_35105, partial [Catenulispora sp.]|nr:hypothetical protein [Catenulispora sp.]
THLRIAHTLGADNPVRAQVVQQWLLPTTSAPLNGAPAELTVDGDNVHVAHRPTVFALSTGLPVSDGPARTPKAIDLPDGRIAAVHNGHLIIGEAFGGAAVRTEPTAG